MKKTDNFLYFLSFVFAKKLSLFFFPLYIYIREKRIGRAFWQKQRRESEEYKGKKNRKSFLAKTKERK
jgi:hypothetical protein